MHLSALVVVVQNVNIMNDSFSGLQNQMALPLELKSL